MKFFKVLGFSNLNGNNTCLNLVVLDYFYALDSHDAILCAMAFWSGTLDSHSAVFAYEVGPESINNLGGATV